MRLEVQAALVRGELVPGDVEVEDGVIVDVGLPTTARGSVAVPGFVDLQVNGFARRRLPLGVDRRLRPRRQRAARGRRHRVSADVHHGARVRDARRAARDAGERLVAARRRRARRGAVPLGGASRHAPARAPARSRPRAARPPARCGPRHGADARAGAAGRRGAHPARARARRRRLGRAHERDGGAGARRLRPRRLDGLAPLQRDAAVPLPRPGRRRRRAHAPRRLRADDRRRASPRRRDGALDLGGGRQVASRSSPTRRRALPGTPARISSATSRSRSPTAACRRARTASWRGRC